ncbi:MULTISPECIES: hypothetical protein [Haloarcula]|uniref:Right handed beta helix region n=1 Tax=Haloarcula pellucida TaxID=1427151 RepID=A0A830GK77_9EURY|nr:MULTISPECIES: hypothetical protein [Halomicroarcula]MBX0347345.1 hypothetical protein [Halomicroarcula pellucida]MDS0276781.1 hypothetical protein [Halomicroarcula sp. S1AR25-4]GGN88200.1 hypothetical protein GCM10009030_07680 [Halomicroarcula pellucida]
MSREWTRRRLLARLGTAGLLGALAGCPREDGEPRTETPTAETPRPTTADTAVSYETPTSADPVTSTPAPADYEQVVDVVEEGADPTGSVSIHSTLQSIDADHTLVRFPPGEYLLDEHWYVDEFHQLGIVGPEATITTVPNFGGPLFGLGRSGDATDLAVEGLTFDFRQGNTGPRPLHLTVADGLYVSDVSVRGEFDTNQDGMRFGVTDPDGTGVIRRLSMPDGGAPQYRNTGCYVGEDHRGHLRFEDCVVSGFPDNGLYASPARGRVDVVGGRYENSGISNVRVSGPATVRGVTVRCTEARRGVPNMRGIRLRGGTDVLVDGCRVVMDRVTGSDGAITCANWLESATIRNTHVTVRADGVRALWAKDPKNGSSAARRYPLQIRDLTVDGSAAGNTAILISGRNGTLLDGLCVCQTGPGRNGVTVVQSAGSALRRSSITVTGTPLVTERAQLDRRDLQLQSLGSPGRVSNDVCDCS